MVPVLSSQDALKLAQEILGFSSVEMVSVTIDHTAIGMSRIARNRVRMQDDGDEMIIGVTTRAAGRAEVSLTLDQLDPKTLRRAVHYLDRLAMEQAGTSAPLSALIHDRRYLPNTVWSNQTGDAMADARARVLAPLVTPMLDAGFQTSAYVGTYAHTFAHVTTQGISVAGEETDAEIGVTGWTSGHGAGWAGQAARDWGVLTPDAIAEHAVTMARRATNPVAVEPGRRVVILDRGAVAPLIQRMGSSFDAAATFAGATPLYNPTTRAPRLGEPIIDSRVTLSSDPNDREGGFLPFNRDGFPLRPATWIDRGTLATLAYDVDFAASVGYTPANDWPRALRMTGGPTSVDEMIASCRDGLYVNRLAFVESADAGTGMLTGVTSGGCYLIRQGRIEKAVKNLRFLVSPWFLLTQLEAIGPSGRAALGYSPSAGTWPIPPIVVPALMVRDFNFVSLADNI